MTWKHGHPTINCILMIKKALLLIDHGSKRHTANDMLFDMVALLREQRPDIIIHGAHMELAAPTIDDGVNDCINSGATYIAAFPYMLSPGQHAIKDIPRLVKSSVSKHPNITVEIMEPFGIDIRLAELILKRSKLL